MQDFNLNMDSIKNFFKNLSYEQLLKVVIIIVAGFIIIRLLRALLMRTVFKRANKQNQMMIRKLINYSGFILLLIIILSELGISLTALLGAAGILGIAFGVASQKSLGNIISGFFMVTEKSFEIGDVITVGDKTGVVHSVELLSIMLKTFDNLLIRIPNETLISTDIINITRFPIRRMDLSVSVSYKSDLNLVMKTLRRIGAENPYCLDEPAPFLMISSFDDSGISLRFGVWFDKTQYIDTRNSIMNTIIEEFRRLNIEIPFPQVTINHPAAETSEDDEKISPVT